MRDSRREPIRFRGICLNGHLQGKEIEGFVQVDTTDNIRLSEYREYGSHSSGWSIIVVLLLALIGVNLMVDKTPGFENSPFPEVPTSVPTLKGVPQSKESPISVPNSDQNYPSSDEL